MSAIPCSSVSLKTMMDGTLRISFDIEPRHAQDAFRLFASPGTPAAIAALKVGYESFGQPKTGDSFPVYPSESIEVDATKEVAEKPKGGPLAKLAGMWCNDPNFWEWLETDPHNCAHSERGAALCLYALCGIESRAELDHDPVAAEKFHRLVRGPYSRHLIARGIVS